MSIKPEDSRFFWMMASEFINANLINLRKVSDHTVTSYKLCLNKYIEFLVDVKSVKRNKISFSDFERNNVKEFLALKNGKYDYSSKTRNQRLTAIKSFLEYASHEDFTIMPIYLSVRNIKSLKPDKNPIKFLEKKQLKSLLAAPNISKKTERRNQMILILMYDVGARISEVLSLKISSLHLNKATPHVTLLTKGKKYRNVPIMNKTKEHLEKYLLEFHGLNPSNSENPLFYSKIHNTLNHLSHDTIENVLKKYAKKCNSDCEDFPLDLTSHMIRKTRAMNLYQDGVPLPHIQQLLGHEDISTTSGFYAFATLETLKKSLFKKQVDDETKRWNDKKILKDLYKF